MRCVSIAWAPALAPVKHVPVVDVGERHCCRLQQGWRYLRQDPPGPLRRAQDLGRPLRRICQGSAGDRPALSRERPELSLSSPRASTTSSTGIPTPPTGEIDRIPQVLVAREDGERIGRLLASGHPVWADLGIPNRIGGPIKAANVSRKSRAARSPTNSSSSARISTPGNWAQARSTTAATPRWSSTPCAPSKLPD